MFNYNHVNEFNLCKSQTALFFRLLNSKPCDTQCTLSKANSQWEFS